ncbi:MAG: phosphoribosylanthranilate isomerase [Phycisphaerales bacterium]
MARTRIKICGITDEDTLAVAIEAGADAVGFVFVKDSPRYIDPSDADALISLLPPWVSAVGVFRDPDVDEFCDIEEACPFLAMNQLHGDEDVRTVKSCGPDVLKAIAFDPHTFSTELDRWAVVDEVAAILVDGVRAGSGEPIDWNALSPFLDTAPRPIMLAGGLTPDNVAQAIGIVRPYAVDVSSGVERERGVKDPELIEAFCRAVRRADEHMERAALENS